MKIERLIIVVSLFCALLGCSPTPEKSRAAMEELAKSITPGLSTADLVKKLGEPDAKEDADPSGRRSAEKLKKTVLWRYKKVDQFYEIWVTISEDKVQWAMAWDKASLKNTG